jgi:short chain dehydrogenase
VEEPDGMIDRDHDVDKNNASSSDHSSTNQQQWTSKFWPPWPFAMLHHHGKEEEDNAQVLAGSTTNAAANGDNSQATTTGTTNGQRRTSTRPSMDYYSSVVAHVWSRSRRSARVAARNIQEVGSQLWYHLPPGAPPLLLLASWPHRHPLLPPPTTIVLDAAASTTAAPAIMKKTVIPLLSNPFVRSIALSAAGLAFISWGHAELRQKRRLTALPLPERYRDINRALLPPFLPAAVAVAPPKPSWYYSATPNAVKDDNDRDDTTTTGEEEQSEDTTMFLSPPRRLRRYWNDVLGNSPRSTRSLRTGWRDLRYRREIRKCERRNDHRLVIFDELVSRQQALQKNNNNKKTAQQNRRKNSNNAAVATNSNSSDLGYALVTGASKGIGRALAVELARWEIPLILVARDADALAALAGDLETCYGISCYVVPADLARDGTAQQLYRTVKKAGLKVDVSSNRCDPIYQMD